MSKPNFLLYCHNVLGLGHITRSSRIATAIKQKMPEADVAIVTGCRALGKLKWPEGIGLHKLPALDPASLTTPRNAAILGKRQRMLEELLREIQPDVFLVDYVPAGLRGELIPTMQACNNSDWPTYRVLGVPYLINVGKRNPTLLPRMPTAMDFYDSFVCYTDPSVDPVFDHLKPYLKDKPTHYAGYTAEVIPEGRRSGTDHAPDPTQPPLVTVLNGGGSKESIFELVEQALLKRAEAGEIRLRILVGVLNYQGVPDAFKDAPNVELIPAATALDATQGASVVVTRCGYNTSFAVAQLPMPVIMIPEPTLKADEQHNRAALLSSKVERIWDVKNQPKALSDALDVALAEPFKPREIPFNLNGVEEAARWLVEEALPHSGRYSQKAAS